MCPVVFPQLKAEIPLGLTALEDPLGWLLDVLEDSGEWKGKGHSLAAHLVQGLQIWLAKQPSGQLVRLALKSTAVIYLKNISGPLWRSLCYPALWSPQAGL